MRTIRSRHGLAIFVLWMTVTSLLAGVGKEVENDYKQRYENKALFLKQPVRGEEQTFYLRGQAMVQDMGTLGEPLTFRVGEQVRILEVNFKDSEVEFKVSSIDLARRASIRFDFGQSIPYTFPQRPSFDRALSDTFTEGLTYSDLDQAKAAFVKDQYGRVVHQFADTTGTSEKFVEQTILSSIPEMADLKKENQDLHETLDQTKQQLNEEQERRRTAENEVRETKSSLTAAHSSTVDLRRKLEDTENERDRLQKDVARLGNENRTFKEQVDEIARRLDVQVGSNSKLDQQVGDLTRNLDALTQERSRLAGEVGELGRKVTQLTQERETLTRQLGEAQKKASKLEGNLRAVTSNRESLEATYLRTKEGKEALERADRLAESLSLRPAAPGGSEDGVERAEVYLLSQPIATLEIRPPESANESARLVIRASSPNTVQFTEEERGLYDALGGALKIQTNWRSWAGSLKPVLESGESVQSTAPREESTWQWTFQGSPSPDERLLLDLKVVDADGQSVPLGSYRFPVSGSGWMASVGDSPWLFGAAGFLLGVALVGMAVAVRDRQSSKRLPPTRRVSVPTAKEL